MTPWLVALVLAASVLLLVRALGLLRHSRAVLAEAEASLAVVGDRMLDDDGKERALRRHALRLFKYFFLLAAGGAAALLLPLAALRFVARRGLVSEEAVHDITLSWPFLLAGVLLGVGVVLYRRPRRASRSSGVFENRYGAVDRWLHHLAFASAPVQIVIARAEERAHREQLESTRLAPPVFITALPRAGTTLLLNLCARREEFATHTYRRMPFLLTPLWWEKFSKTFRLADTPRERAHGDGLLVSADSPEALEEMLWLNFWPEHYEPRRIRPWSRADDNPEFVAFFEAHMRKLVVTSSPRPPALSSQLSALSSSSPRRYVSKNNANISRIAWLAKTFPDARFVVPFRSPLQHAASLLRQHTRFSEIHRKDPFARQYMANIGHFDFGANLRPIDFNGWSLVETASPTTLEYWLRYWTAAYRHLATFAGDRVRLVDFEALCTAPAEGLASLAEFLDLHDRDAFILDSRDIRRPKRHAVDENTVPAPVLAEARRVHLRLVEIAGTTDATDLNHRAA